MYTGGNKTARNSQKSFADALVRLLERKNFADISVSELCQESGVSRQTFYSLFRTKENVLRYELLNNYQHSEGLTEPGQGPVLPWMAHAFAHYIVANYPFLKLMVDNGLIQVFCECGTDWLLSRQNEFLGHVPQNRREIVCLYISGTLWSLIEACVQSRAPVDADYLESVLRDLFGGAYFRM